MALLLFVSALVAVLLLWWSSQLHDGGGKDFLNAIATGLLVSAAFGMAQAFITGRATSELLRASVIDEVNRSLSESNQEFFPTHDFAQRSSPNPAFNVLLKEDLNESSTFWFRGLSARYTAARLLQNRSANLRAILILPDPQVASSIDGRVLYEIRQGLSPGKSRDEVRHRVLQDMKVGITGLHEARNHCAGIELVLTPAPLLDRYEIFRNSIWVTLFSDKNQATKFPRTLRFNNTSMTYRMHEAECIQTRQHPASRRIDITNDTDLGSLLLEVFGNQPDQQEVAELQSEVKRFVKEFSMQVGTNRSE